MSENKVTLTFEERAILYLFAGWLSVAIGNKCDDSDDRDLRLLTDKFVEEYQRDGLICLPAMEKA